MVLNTWTCPGASVRLQALCRAQIGIYNPSGEKVGEVARLRNLEYVVVAGPKGEVEAMTAPYIGVSKAEAGQGSLFAEA